MLSFVVEGKWARALGVLGLIVGLTLVGCASDNNQTENSGNDGGTTTEATTGNDGGTTTKDEPTATKKWDDMDFDEKRKFMQTDVMPAMATMFKEYDAAKYEKFSCATCHGADMVDKKFKMPNGILPFDPKAIPSKGKGVEFMQQKVIPKMLELLGKSPFDPSTGKGFGCFACHGMK